MTSAAVAVTLSVRREKGGWKPAALGAALIALIFAYTTVNNVIERPEGVKIAAFFIGFIVLLSLLSRVWRTTELRVGKITLDETAQRFVNEAKHDGVIRILANHPRRCDAAEYASQETEARENQNLPAEVPLLFMEMYVRDASEFSADLDISGVEVDGHRVLRGHSAAVPNAIAAFLLYLRDTTGTIPHAYFHWGERNPLLYLIRYVLSGQGDVAPLTREILRQAEPDLARRPAVHAGI